MLKKPLPMIPELIRVQTIQAPTNLTDFGFYFVSLGARMLIKGAPLDGL